jgi:hypothetical protein
LESREAEIGSKSFSLHNGLFGAATTALHALISQFQEGTITGPWHGSYIDTTVKGTTVRSILAGNGFTLSSHLSGLTCRESKSGKMPRAARGLPRMSVAGSKRRPAAKRRHVAAGLPVSRFWLPPGP